MARRIRFRKGVNINRVITKVAITIIGLYVGGTILTELGSILNLSQSGFYGGLTIIGWTVGGYPNCNTTHFMSSCTTAASQNCSVPGTVSTTQSGAGCITAVTGTGLLGVIGIVAVASIVLEFVQVRM